MTTKNIKANSNKKNDRPISESPKSARRTTKTKNVENIKNDNTTHVDNTQVVLQYSHSDVQQILYLSMVTGFMLCNHAHQNKLPNVNLDKLAENVFKHLKTRKDLESLLSSPIVALGFALEASEAIKITEEKPTKPKKNKGGKEKIIKLNK